MGKDDIKSNAFSLSSITPLLSGKTGTAYTLHQICIFAKTYCSSPDWADYIMEAQLSGITQIDNSDADESRAFLIGTKHIFNGLNTKIEPPKSLNIASNKKRKLSNSVTSNEREFEPLTKNKKFKTMNRYLLKTMMC